MLRSLLGMAIAILILIPCAPALAQVQGRFATCDPSTNSCIKPNSDGSINVSGSFSATTACTASASAPTYTAGVNPLSCDLSGNLRTGGGAITAAVGAYAAGSLAAGAGVDGWNLTEGATGDAAYAGSGSASIVAILKGIYASATGSIPAGTALVGKFGIDQTTPGVTNGVQVNAALPAGANVVGYVSSDPCAQAAKSYADFSSTTSGGSIITAVSGKKAYLCSVSIIASAAANVSLIEGTGSSVCTAGTTAGVFLNSGVTAANGAAVAANGGIQAGNGAGTVAANGTANQNVCVAFTTTNSPQVNVHVAYVQQ